MCMLIPQEFHHAIQNPIDLEGRSLAKDSSNDFVLSKFNTVCFSQQLLLWKEVIHLFRK